MALNKQQLSYPYPHIKIRISVTTQAIEAMAMAAASQLTICTPNPRASQTLKSTKPCPSLNIAPALSFKKHVMGIATGILAASAVAAAIPLEADATRIEYFATVSEPSCELNFVRSGLGYCDVVVGSGEEVPFAQLINVSFHFPTHSFLVSDHIFRPIPV